MTGNNVHGKCRCHFVVMDHLGRHIDTLYCILPTGHGGVHRDSRWSPWMNRNEIMEDIHKTADNPFSKSATGKRGRVFFLPNIRVPDK